jgi:hypothetical protein
MPLFSLLGNLISPLTTYLQNKGQLQQAAHELEMAQLSSATEQAKISATTNVETLTAQLAATGPGFKDATFILVMLPVIITCIFPAHGKAIFDNISMIPQWYQVMIVSIISAIWGIRNVITPFVNGGVMKKLIDKQEFFNDYRKFNGGKPLDQATVDLLDKVLDDNDNKG